MAEAFSHYDHVAASYDEPRHEAFYGHLAEKLCDCLERYVRPGLILDIGCGTGISTMEIVKRFPEAMITALDQSPSMLGLAQKKNLKRVSFCHGRPEKIARLSKKFDLAVANMSFHWLSAAERLILRDVLKEKGFLAISFPLIAPFRKGEGNRVLFTIFGKLKEMDPNWHPSHGTRGLNWKEIRALPGLVPVCLEPYCIEETFERGSEFIEVLRVRGVFLGLFGTKAVLAEECTRQAIPEDAAITYSWPIGIAILQKQGMV